MLKLSDRLTRELTERGNLPISAEGLMRLRPDIAGELSAAQSVLANEIEVGADDSEGNQSEGDQKDLLEARFVAASASAEQRHLFMLAPRGAEGESNGLQRWSKTAVSYGSLVQVKEFLTEAWGGIRGLELQRSQYQLDR